MNLTPASWQPCTMYGYFYFMVAIDLLIVTSTFVSPTITILRYFFALRFDDWRHDCWRRIFVQIFLFQCTSTFKTIKQNRWNWLSILIESCVDGHIRLYDNDRVPYPNTVSGHDKATMDIEMIHVGFLFHFLYLLFITDIDFYIQSATSGHS